jgi:hypothetical protein
VAREFAAAAGTQLGGAASPFREARLVAIILDAVTMWDVSSSLSMANALLRGVRSVLVQVYGDVWAYAAALRPTVVIVRSCGCEITDLVCDGLSAQANTVDPNCARPCARTVRNGRALRVARVPPVAASAGHWRAFHWRCRR